MRESARWLGSFAFVLGLDLGAIRLALGWAVSEVPYAPPPEELPPVEIPLAEVVLPAPEPPPPVDLKPPPPKPPKTD